MSDSAYSDLAPVAYAVVIHKTFGWSLPNEEKTREFVLSRQQPDGAFVNVAGTVDPKSAAGRAYNTTMERFHRRDDDPPVAAAEVVHHIAFLDAGQLEHLLDHVLRRGDIRYVEPHRFLGIFSKRDGTEEDKGGKTREQESDAHHGDLTSRVRW